MPKPVYKMCKICDTPLKTHNSTMRKSCETQMAKGVTHQTWLQNHRNNPLFQCLDCRNGNHDECDRKAMRFCVCRADEHMEVF